MRFFDNPKTVREGRSITLNDGAWTGLSIGDDYATLDGDYTATDLRDIANYIEEMQKKESA